MAYEIERGAYADMFGPTTGDKVRLADTDLIIEVEGDRTSTAKRSNSAVARSSATGWGNPRSRAPEGRSIP